MDQWGWYCHVLPCTCDRHCPPAPLPPGGSQVVALDAVLPMWLERARDMQGRFRTALCMTALGLMLETRHPRLDEIKVLLLPSILHTIPHTTIYLYC